MKPINLAKLMAKYEEYTRADNNYYYYFKESANEVLPVITRERYAERARAYFKEELEIMNVFTELANPVNDIIAEVEGRSSERLITTFQIVEYLVRFTKRLDVTKKVLNGCVISVNLNAQRFARAYKYTPKSTWFDAEFKSGSWRLTNVYRDTCTNTVHKAVLPEEAKQMIISRMENA